MTQFDFTWWIQVIEIPALAGIFLWLRAMRQDLDHRLDTLRAFTERKLEDTREKLAAYKVEVAQKYASQSYIRDLEKRLTDHLIRIEEKLEK